MRPDFPILFLDDGKRVYFGQDLLSAEVTFAMLSTEDPSPVARKGIDKIITASAVRLEFDTERLKSISFGDSYEFRNAPTPFWETWKNFESIGDCRISYKMSRADFVSYIVAWENRASSLGAQKVESPDLGENQYRLSFEVDKFFDMFHAAMGPSRRAGGGGIWSDGWTAFFKPDKSIRRDEQSGALPKLRSLSASSDTFNTVARRKS